MNVFKSKAETLAFLEGNLENAYIQPQLSFKVADWKNNHLRIIDLIFEKSWGKDNLVVRSSSMAEDSEDNSLAGFFTSVINVRGRKNIISAINSVIESYKQRYQNDLVLIQPYLQNVKISGVAFSKNPSNGSDYTVINYDDTSGSTNSVTSGVSNELKTYYFFNTKNNIPEVKFKKVIDLLKELELKLNSNALDIEFAIDHQDTLHLFQVRPLIINKSIKNIDSKLVLEFLESANQKFNQLSSEHPFLCGKKSIFGLMPDWNPAEILGTRPKSLAFSLYKELITDNIWAYQRDNYGYKNLRSFPLIINFCGIPYIDVRVSFNSFIPAGIDDKLANKLVEFYIDRLIENPDLHDKVEFDIVYSCYTFDIQDRIKDLLNFGFDCKETNQLVNNLKLLTNKIISSEEGLWKKDLKKINILKKRRNKIIESNLDQISKIYWLIEDCKRYGTLPFAGLARAAFIAMQILKSLVKKKIISKKEYMNFLYSLNTVNSELVDDFNTLDFEDFIKIYGHLRPGTYDILQSRYDENPERYFNSKQPKSQKKSKNIHFKISERQIQDLQQLINDHQLEIGVVELLDFLKEAIEGREYAKFIFTQNLSDTLQLIEMLGKEKFGITKEDLAHIEINELLNLYSSSLDGKEKLLKQIETSKNNYLITEKIHLPKLMVKENDIWAFEVGSSEPNFITLNVVEGDILTEITQDLRVLKNKILFIPSADPGYDWIFSHQIAGFVTMYGGANSHMAIRAGELGMPAVIGAGETLFRSWSSNKRIEINCASKKVTILI